jgi:predicted transcriptional regulator
MRYRSRTEITAMILDAANGETTKTKIMYNAYLSYNQLKEFLSILTENNLLEYLDGTRTFKTTEKGLNFLKLHREMAELLQTTTIKNDDDELI